MEAAAPPLRSPPPGLTERLDLLAGAARAALSAHGLESATVHLIEDKKNATFRVERPGGGALFLRMSPGGDPSPEELRSEAAWLRALSAAGVEVADPVPGLDGASVREVPIEGLGETRWAAVFRWLPGRPLDAAHLTPDDCRRMGELLGRLHRVSAGFEPPPGFVRPRRDELQWLGGGEVIPAGRGEPLITERHRRMLDEAADKVRGEVAGLGRGPGVYGLTHTDLEPDNVLDDGGRLHPIDFTDFGWSYFLYDVAASLLPVAARPDFPELRTAFVEGYRRRRPLDAGDVERLGTFLVARSLFSMRLIVREYWEDPRRRRFAETLFPFVLGEVRRYLRDRRGGAPTAVASTVELLDALRRKGVRLQAEGARLRLDAPRGALSPELSEELGRRKAEILAFLGRVADDAGTARAQRIPKVPRDGPLPLSFAQNRLWLLHRMAPESSTYNVFAAVRLSGPLRLSALAATLRALVARHETLRTTFTTTEAGEPRQVIAPPGPRALPVVDLSGLGPGGEVECRRLVEREIHRPFDLERGPLLRATLLRRGGEDHALVMTKHHVISDGWSMGVMIRELSQLYAAFAGGRRPALPPLEVQYADFAAWQRRHLEGGVLEEQLAYWRERLADAPELLELPTDRPRRSVRREGGGSRVRFLGPGAAAELRLLAQRTDATLFMVLLAAYQVILGHLAGQEDVVAGSPIANRRHAQLEGLIGFFVNTLVLRTRLGGDPSFLELLDGVRRTTLGAYGHQDLPFERLVEELAPERSTAHPPLFQVFFALQNAPRSELEMAGLTLEPMAVERGTSQFDLILTAEERPDGLRLALRFATDLFDATTAERWLGGLARLLEAVARSPAARLSELTAPPPAERHQLLLEWNDTAPAAAPEPLVPRSVTAAAAARPDAVAVVAGGRTWTYGELQRRADRVARRLRALGAGPERVVAVCLPRSPEWLAALHAVLGTGAAYLPLDPGYPPERLGFMVRDAGASVLVTDAALAGRCELDAGCPTLLLDREAAGGAAGEPADAAPPPAPDGLAYLIYTSGSTGRPKGVELTHRGLSGLVAWHRRRFAVDQETRSVQVAGQSFDASVWEVWPYLAAGAALVLPDEETRLSAAALRDFVVAERITVAFLPTPMAEAALQERWPEETALGRLLTGGDRLRRAPPPGMPFALVNNYGPTENTVVATSGTTPAAGGERVAPTIGRAIDGVSVAVLDRGLGPRPLGAVGELCLGGSGLARGYRGRPARTAERFVPDPGGRAPGGRLYRTGDLVRYRGDGEVLFLGRDDAQVKIRGFRIELGEIEAALAGAPGVAECAVVVREDGPGGRRLVAYAAGAAGVRPRAAGIHDHLARRLPEYMVPAIVVLDALPVTPNGKLDRQALPDPGDAPSPDGAPAAAGDPELELVADLMADVLGVERVPPGASFFDLGGHSLLATRLVSRLRQVFGVELPLRALFDAPSAVRLVRALRRARSDAGAEVALPLLPDGGTEPAPLSFAQERLWFLDRLDPGSPVYNMPFAIRLRGRLDRAVLRACLEEIVRRHGTLRTTFDLSGERPVQLVRAAASEVGLPRIDLAGLPPERREREARRLQDAAARHRFDLRGGASWLVRLLDLGTEHRLLLTFHHAIADGWSIAVLTRELAALYAALAEGRPSPLPELPVQYADYARWQRRWLDSPALEGELAYWRRQLAGVSHASQPLRSRPRPAVQTFRGGAVTRELSADLSAAVRALARRTGTTLFMVLLAALDALLHRLSGLTEIVVGAPIAGRDRAETEGLIGVFLNTLALRVDVTGAPSFLELLGRVRETALAAYAHQRVPFERLLQALQPSRDLSRTPWFQVFLNVLNLPPRELSLPSLELDLLHSAGVAAKFDLTLYAEDRPEGLRLHWVYNADLFPAARMEETARQLERLLGRLTAHPDESILAPPLRSPAEGVLPDPARPLPAAAWNGGVDDRFRRRAAETPDTTAVVDGRGCWSYGALAAAARHLAGRLRAAGPGPGDLVAVHAGRDASLAWALLGVLEAGCAFLVLDAGEPPERLASYLRAARPRAVLELALAGGLPPAAAGALGHARRLALPYRPPSTDDGAGPAVTDPDALAYVVFTSGTTGRPKGIRGSHRPLAHYLDWASRTFGFGPADRVSLLSGLGHDPLLRDLFTPLSTGGTLAVPPAGHRRDPDALAAWLRAERITVAHLTPPLGRMLLSSGDPGPSALRLALFGGDALPADLAGRLAAWSGGAGVVGFYGTTETPQAAAWRPVGREETAAVPLGRGIEGFELLVVAPGGQPAGFGERGEILVRSRYLSLGYLDGGDVPGGRYAANPWTGDPEDRVYRTGDWGCYLEDGSVLFLGRADDQVSVRGFRVEPAEVAAALGRHPGVREAVVAARGARSEERALVAWYAPAGEAPPAEEELRRFLAESLPEPMVPAAFVPLPALPLDARAKVDRRALPDPPAFAAAGTPRAPVRDGGRPPAAPRDRIELALVGIFEAVLGRGGVAVTDEFFALGGHSLLTVLLLERIHQAFGHRIPLAGFFQEPTVAATARRLRENLAGAPVSPLVALQPAGTRPPFFCVHAVGGTVVAYRDLARRLGELGRGEDGGGAGQPFYGLEAVGGAAEVDSVEGIAARYRRAVREVAPHGPYRLGGWSMGGVLAFEMARQLEADGEEVALLALIDSFAPGLEERGRATDRQLLGAFVRDLAAGSGGLPAEWPGSDELQDEGVRGRLLAELEGRGLVPPGTDPGFLQERFELFRALRRALLAYTPAPGELAAPVALFEAAEHRPAPPAARGWRRFLAGDLQVRTVPGSHYSLLRTPQVESLAVQLAACLAPAPCRAGLGPRSRSAG